MPIAVHTLTAPKLGSCSACPGLPREQVCDLLCVVRDGRCDRPCCFVGSWLHVCVFCAGGTE
eukprot:15475716-Alexandrium_andersonii.AAC.1